MQTIRISVITVCYNAADTIVGTIESVLGQTYENLEYCIIDGLSTDGTQELIHRYEDNDKVKTLFEADSGLYNAMNKGIDLCSGEYVLFLNSGDVFADASVVSRSVEQMCRYREEKQITASGRMPDIFYGNVIRTYETKRVTEKYPGKHKVFQLLMMGKMPCHQSIFTSAPVLKKYKFDETYQICADFDFLVRCLRGGVAMQYIDVDISAVDCVMGISSQNENLERMRMEDDRSLRKQYPLCYAVIQPLKIIIRKCRNCYRYVGR